MSGSSTITQTASFGPTATDWGTPDAVSLHFTGFNTSLGTLTAVSVSVTEKATGTVQNTNTGPNSTIVTSKIINSWDVFLPFILDGTYDINGTTRSNPASDSLAAGATGPMHSVTGSSSESVSSVAGYPLNAYERPFVMTADDFGSVFVHGNNNLGTANYQDFGMITAMVTYTYTPATAHASVLFH